MEFWDALLSEGRTRLDQVGKGSSSAQHLGKELVSLDGELQAR